MVLVATEIMITTQQWRVTIGVFGGGKHYNKINKGNVAVHESIQTVKLKDLCCRLFVCAIVLWLVYLEHCALTTATTLFYHYVDQHSQNYVFNDFSYQPIVNTILLCGDVESNPGPVTVEEQITLLTVNINEKFAMLSNELRTVTAHFEKVESTLN